ncbi:MAG TPA: hypothetical protein ENN27_00625 [Candidatus Atribacteria bacterium]|nr:hypothetical protein [Candidatus Atribacteria bacterium]
MFDKCPGAANIRTPTIKIKKCPECGEEVEIFSDEMQVKCSNCGFTVYNDLQSCVQWCKYAKECVGEELYKKLKKKRIAFVCTENSCRSQIAEAVAKKLCDKSNIEFISMGTHPATEVDQKALEVLQEEGIRWHGKPKIISNKEQIDVIVTMGCDVACPIIANVKIVRWDIQDPKGKGIDDYRRTLRIIKEKIIELLKEEVS